MAFAFCFLKETDFPDARSLFPLDPFFIQKETKPDGEDVFGNIKKKKKVQYDSAVDRSCPKSRCFMHKGQLITATKCRLLCNILFYKEQYKNLIIFIKCLLPSVFHSAYCIYKKTALFLKYSHETEQV